MDFIYFFIILLCSCNGGIEICKDLIALKGIFLIVVPVSFDLKCLQAIDDFKNSETHKSISRSINEINAALFPNTIGSNL